MRVAVVGATGLVGRHVVDLLTERGHDVVGLARSTGVDVLTGRGLAPAVEGVEAVIDVSNIRSWRRSTTVGVDRVPGFGYYQGELARERVALTGPVPATVVRATQFHEFPTQILSATKRGPVAFVPRMRIQPIASRSAAEVLADRVTAPGTGAIREIAGPEQHDLPDLARRWLRHRGQRAVVLAARLPGATGRAQVGGAPLPGTDALVAGPALAEWLSTQPPGRRTP